MTSDAPFGPYRLDYTEAMVRDAVNTYVRRRLIGETKASWIIMLFFAILLVSLIWNGDRSWFVGAVGVAVLAPFLLVAIGWRAHFINTVGRFRRMQAPVAQVTLHEDRLSLASDLGSGDLTWPSFTEVWERPGYWMVFSGRNQFNIVPIANIPGDELAWLRGKLPASEVKPGRAGC
jgi:hypothetical protein